MTFIPVAAFNTEPDDEAQRYLLRRAGYPADGSTIIVVNLNDCRAANSPYEWGARTLKVAHDYLEKHFGELADGAVIDVEFILGETDQPKVSEAKELASAAPAPWESSKRTAPEGK
jgi:hypothetical protein